MAADLAADLRIVRNMSVQCKPVCPASGAIEFNSHIGAVTLERRIGFLSKKRKSKEAFALRCCAGTGYAPISPYGGGSTDQGPSHSSRARGLGAHAQADEGPKCKGSRDDEPQFFRVP
jgi:hypothetical protein